MKISLENDALASQGSYAGTYKISTNVNGKPSYTFGEKAIWYYEGNNLWIIGLIDDLGNSVMGARNEFAGLTDNRNDWIYGNGDEVTDINVQCTQ